MITTTIIDTQPNKTQPQTTLNPKSLPKCYKATPRDPTAPTTTTTTPTTNPQPIPKPLRNTPPNIVARFALITNQIHI
jgi:hypothetical protein